MARRKRAFGRPIDGVLILNKAAGMTSNAALQQAKRLLFAAKAGHTGSLDPLATGVLPLCFGEATKFSQYLLEADKRYRTTVRFGVTTTTGDADGEVLTEIPTEGLTEAALANALGQFEGDILQVPSMYSALKHEGEPLYKLAREGKEVERQARPVTVYALTLLAFRPGPEAEADLEIHCSKGTYVRTLAEDLGRELGCGAHVARLHRVAAGPFDETRAVSLEQLSGERGDGRAETLDHHLLPVDAPVSDLEKVTLPETTGFYFRQGQPVMDTQVYRVGAVGDMVRVFQEDGDFLGVGEVTDDGRLAPKRLTVKHSVSGGR
ncbi:tRNA pseudouridine(55) synthase TruB [Exilibacterium tricleocarpae]|uniref:tRNA pseudouridine synthase B n=1 Tax=Exilibacterium tricleocarpae TaxID=2591008 RepID=A0A545SZV8_9GAMM|nr:tRNA pseudouridine(55) synthase TruB [Exilibacterium tricleocarpae]TQV70503.1 tRNA pseudouridine(55) synthase TruB [Exilibacterium tricleocarpae]